MYTHNSPKAFEGRTLRSLSLALASSAVVMGFIGAVMPSPAAAAQLIEPRQEIVRFRDLDLTKAADTERLRTRIRRAAKRVCSQPGAAGLWMKMKEELCVYILIS